MTGNSDQRVPVRVSLQPESHAGDTLPTPFICYVVQDGTLTELRIVLLEDEIIQPGHRYVFEAPNGRFLGKSAEDYIRWHDLLKDDEVSVFRMPASPTIDCDTLSVVASDTAADDKCLENAVSDSPYSAPGLPGVLTLHERLLLIRKSKLGQGINVCDDQGPQYSGHSVIADIDPRFIHQLDLEGIQNEVLTTTSARTGAYIRAGWTMPAIDSIKMQSVDHTESQSSIWVVGRRLLSSCQFTLPGVHILKPHPEFQAAVDQALAEKDSARRAQKLDAVWRCYGHVYMDSVEMGGMCYLACTATKTDSVNQELVDAEMRRTLNKTFGFRDGIQSSETWFDNQHFQRVGGLERDQDAEQWRSTLIQPANWAVTRTLRVVPVVSLFDEETQRKILLNNDLPAARVPRCQISSTPRTALEMGILLLKAHEPSSMSTFLFSQPFNTPPAVLLGIHGLDFDHRTMLRIAGNVQVVAEDHADLTVFTWSDSRQWGCSLSWLALPSEDPDLQYGTFETTDDHPEINPQAQTTRTIRFERPYGAIPRVTVWLSRLSMDSADNRIRIATYVTDVSPDGFTVHIDTWDGSTIWAAGISWLAYSASRTDIATGVYDTRDTRPKDELRKLTSGHVSFGHAQFHPRPTSVFTAVHGLDASRDQVIRLGLMTDKVTSIGMDWHIVTWSDSVLFSAGVSFIAF